MPPTVVVTEPIDAPCADWLAGRATVLQRPYQQLDALHAALATADALIVRTYTRVDAALLDRAPNLRVVGRAGVGLDNIDLPACRDRGITVVYTPDANSAAVAEYVFALILDQLRPRTTLTPDTTPETFHQLRKQDTGTQLDTLTLGVLGFGRIGRRVARIAHAIGMRTLVHDVLPIPDPPTNPPCIPVDQPTLLSDSDILTIHTDGRPDNRHLLTRDQLTALKPTCILINTARGMLIDHNALAAWAAANPQARAILDVHDPEPPNPADPLFALPNVRLLPHTASRTNHALRNMSWVVRDVAAVLDGRTPDHPA